MINLYTQKGNRSSNLARQWLIAHNIEFKEKNFSKTPPTQKDLKYILSFTENGLDDIISTRSKYYQNIVDKLSLMPLNFALDLLCEHPTLLRRPIVAGHGKLLVGFSEENIRCFIPREYRQGCFSKILDMLDSNNSKSNIREKIFEY